MQSSHTFNQRLYAHAEHRGSSGALCFLPEGEGQEFRLTYAQLHSKAAALAARLQNLGATGERVILATHDNVAFTIGFVACLYSGAVVVPVPMLDLKRPGPALPRLQAIIADAKARFFLTDSVVHGPQAALAQMAPSLAALTWLSAYEEEMTAQLWQPPAVTADTLAFLQYTSGSTGTPKGVMVSQGNLLHNSTQLERSWRNDSSSIFASWLPQFHDFGLVSMAMQSLYLGTLMVSMPPSAFVKKPARWMRCVSNYRATVTGAPNFAYDLAMSRTNEAEREGLDLSCVQTAGNGAEPVRAETMRRFQRMYAAYGLREGTLKPAYGLAEATVFVSALPRQPLVTVNVDTAALGRDEVVLVPGASAQSREFVSCGLPGDELEVAIVAPGTHHALAPRAVGEICVRGDSVSTGYFGNPEASKATFDTEVDGRRGFLRTGDIGFMHEGNVFVTGRHKDLIIVRGVNHYPQDFEATMESAHPLVRAGFTAAFAVDQQEGHEALVVLAELTADEPTPAMCDAVLMHIREAIAAAHEMAPREIVLLRKGTIPKTSSGKIQRRLCRQQYCDNQLQVWARQAQAHKEVPVMSTERSPKYKAIEQYVLELLKLQPAEVKFDHNLASYGFDSVDGASLSQRIAKDWGVEVPLEVLPSMSIRELVEAISG